MDRSLSDSWVQEHLSRGSTTSDPWRETERRSANDSHLSARVGDATDERLSRLARAIELEIIPRLMLAHRLAEPCPIVPALHGEKVSRKDVEDFAKLVLATDEALPLACVAALRARGISVEKIYLDLLAPTARYLGDLWNEDLCDFTEVTVGLGRLQQVLRELSPEFGQSHEQADNGRRVLLLPSPGEQHTFGLVMVTEFFRRAGWQVAGGPWETALDAADMVSSDWFDVAGFSLGSEVHLDALGGCIAAVRQGSRNRGIGIMVGGPIFIEHPEYVARIGADAVALDGRQAPVIASQLIDQRASSC